jgi:hypothetical protein
MRGYEKNEDNALHSRPLLRDFWNNSSQQKRVARERDTARFIRKFWTAGQSMKNDAQFLTFLVRCGWTNESHGRGRRSTVTWRNHHLAKYLRLTKPTAAKLADEVGRRFPSLKEDASNLLSMETGITHCYGAVRKITVDFVLKRPGTIASAFRVVPSGRQPEKKIAAVMKLVDLTIKNRAGHKINLLNGITPVLACLDPDERFPIINGKTRPFLRKLGQQLNRAGALELYRQIGKHKIRNSFALDVYAATQFAVKRRRRRKQRQSAP